MTSPTIFGSPFIVAVTSQSVQVYVDLGRLDLLGQLEWPSALVASGGSKFRRSSGGGPGVLPDLGIGGIP